MKWSTILLLLMVLAIYAPVAHADCGALPADYPIWAHNLTTHSGSTMNGYDLAVVNSYYQTAIGLDGTLTSFVSVTIPDFSPASFQSASGGSSVTQSSAPFAAGDYSNVTLGDGSDVTFSGGEDYRINTLTVGNNVTLRFNEGNYFINNVNADGDNVTIIAASSKVRIFIGSAMNLREGVVINASGDYTDVQIYLYQWSSFTLNNGSSSNSEINAVIVGEPWTTATIANDSTLSGTFAMMIHGSLNIGPNTHITFTASDLDNLATVSTCAALPDELAYFSLDSIDSGYYDDDSDNGYSLQTSGDAEHSSEGKICYGNVIGDNNSAVNTDALVSDIDLDSTVGAKGTIAFWFNSANAFNAYDHSRILFDASNASRYLHLMLDRDGRLRFQYQDSDGNAFSYYTAQLHYSAGSWHHIAVSWNMSGGEIAIYVDGTSLNVYPDGSAAWQYSGLASLNTLMFGDSREDYSRNGVTQSANGTFDEIYIYASVLDSSAVQQLYSASHVCPAEPIAYYPYEEGGWNGTADEIQDESGHGLNLTNLDNNATEVSAKICDGAFFNGSDSVLRRDEGSVDQYSSGASVTFWMNPTVIADSTLVEKDGQWLVALTSSGQLQVSWRDGSLVWHSITSSTTALNLNTWYHIGVSIGTSEQSIYIDNVQILANTDTTTLLNQSGGDLRIGSSSDSGDSSNYAGRIDELRIYDQAITADDVSSDLQSTHSCNSDLIGAYYFEDAVWNGTANEVKDSSGNKNHGVSQGATARAEGYLCYGGWVPQNDTWDDKEGIELGVDIDADVGEYGTIMFWYKSDVDWGVNGRQTLMDVSIDVSSDPASYNDKYLYLSTGAIGASDSYNDRLHARFEDNVNDNDIDLWEDTPYPNRKAGQWYHLAFIWDYTQTSVSTKEFKIFVDGEEVANTLSDYWLSTIEGMPNFQRFHIGDNASDYTAAPASSASGSYDEVRIYNRKLTAAEIIEASELTHPCEGEAVVHYQFDETSWDGSLDEVKDESGYEFHGTALNTPDTHTQSYGGSCRAGVFGDDDQSKADIFAVATGVDVDRDLGNAGSVMMWLRNQNDWDNMTGNRVLFDASITPKHFFAEVQSDGSIRFYLNDDLSNSYDIQTGSYSFTDSDWVHVAFTWNLDTQDVAIYVNGSLAASEGSKYPGFAIADVASIYVGDSRGQNSVSSGNAWWGLMDEVRFYNYARTDAEILEDYDDFTPCEESLDHFRITTDGDASDALTCSPEKVVITAYMEDGTLYQNYIGTVELSTTTGHGDWLDEDKNLLSGNGTANDGVASVTFTSADQGGKILYLQDTVAETTNISVEDSDYGKTESSSYDPDYIFNQAGFLWLDDEGNDSPSYLISGTSEAIQLRAVKTDDTTGVCSDLFADGDTVTVSMSSRCDDPDSCISGQQVSIANNGNTTAIANPENGGEGSATDVDLLFASHSSADIELSYPDVGQISITAHYPLVDVDGVATGEIISGSFSTVVKSATLKLENITDSEGAQANPGASDVSGNVFVAAGELFHADLVSYNSLGLATPNFGNESIVPQPDLSAALVAPEDGILGNLSISGDWVSSGDNDGRLQFSSSSEGLKYSEVGAITMTPGLSEYLGTALGTDDEISGDVSGTVGRFVPYQFVVANNFASVAPASPFSASGFVYRDQALTFTTSPIITITAKNSEGTTTQNYDGDFYRLLASYDASVVDISDDQSAYGLTASVTLDHNQGVSTLTVDTLTFNYPTLASLISDAMPIYNPTITIDLLDSSSSATLTATHIHDADDVCYLNAGSCSDKELSLTLSGLSVRLGRATLDNAYGSETRDLALNSALQYWDGSEWISSSDDTFSSITSASLQDLETETGTFVTTIKSIADYSDGIGSVTLSAPGEGNTGSATVVLDVPSYLEFYYQSETSRADPQATATFGIYEGNDKVLYRMQGVR